jgi:hypothetical protein
MANLILQFNGSANELLAGNTRLRVKTQKRGGVEYLALRPSHRVSGKNMQARTAKAENGATLVEVAHEFIKELGMSAPALGEKLLFNDDGYGWFSLRPLPEDATDATPTVVVVEAALMKTAVRSDAPVEKPAKEAKEPKAAKAPKAAKTPSQKASTKSTSTAVKKTAKKDKPAATDEIKAAEAQS